MGPGPGHFVDERPLIVVLDDYENGLRRSADWSAVEAKARVVVHNERLRGEALYEAVKDADAVATVRDRTPFKAELIDRLPKLKLFLFTGVRNQPLDVAALKKRGIPIGITEPGSSKYSTSEIAWTLILAAAKRLEAYLGLVRQGKWRDGGGLPVTLAGGRLGIIGLGSIGQRIAAVGRAFEMEVVAWSPNLTPERAKAGGAAAVTLEELLATSKVVSLSLVPSPQTRKLLNAQRLATMRPDSILVNTARSALIDMDALPAALDAGRPGIAALDVFDDEPLAKDHPLVGRDDVVLSPHLGFVNDPVFYKFATGLVENLEAWLDGRPLPRPYQE
jgi:phosphoglycerate dehydrogenase-like enzyme